MTSALLTPPIDEPGLEGIGDTVLEEPGTECCPLPVGVVNSRLLLLPLFVGPVALVLPLLVLPLPPRDVCGRCKNTIFCDSLKSSSILRISSFIN